MNITSEEARIIWSLGFDSGRVHGPEGASYDEQTKIFDKDVERLKAYGKRLYRKMKPARPQAQEERR